MWFVLAGIFGTEGSGGTGETSLSCGVWWWGGGGGAGGRGAGREASRRALCSFSADGAWQPRAARLDVVRFNVALLQRNHRAYQGRAAHDGHLHFHTAPGLCNYISWLKCRFTSTETLGLLGTGSPGRPPRLSHSPWALWPGDFMWFGSTLLYVQRNHRPYQGRAAQDGPSTFTQLLSSVAGRFHAEVDWRRSVGQRLARTKLMLTKVSVSVHPDLSSPLALLPSPPFSHGDLVRRTDTQTH